MLRGFSGHFFCVYMQCVPLQGGISETSAWRCFSHGMSCKRTCLHSGLTLRWVILGQMFGWAFEERTKQEGECLRCNRWHMTGTWGKQQRPRSSDTNHFKEHSGDVSWEFSEEAWHLIQQSRARTPKTFRFAIPSSLFPPLFSSLPFSLFFLLLLPPPLLAVLQPQYWTWSLLHGRQEVYKWATTPAFLIPLEAGAFRSSG